MCAELHFNTCKEIWVQSDNEQRYDHVPKLVETGHGGKVVEPTVQTDRTVSNNKPDSIIRDDTEGTCMSKDVAVPGDGNVIEKEAGKILKYKDRTIEVQRTWNVKAKVIPVITGATGTISKSLGQYLSNIPGKHEIN